MTAIPSQAMAQDFLPKLLMMSLAIVLGSCQATITSPSQAIQPSASPSPIADAPTAAPSAAPTVSPTVLPTVAPTAGTPPASPPSATPTESLPVQPTATPPGAMTTPSPAPDAWLEPTLVSSRGYRDISLVIDSEGTVHAAAALGPAIHYVTNSSGNWSRERISQPGDNMIDRQPSIAIDPEDVLSVAFVRYGAATPFGRLPEGVEVVTGGPGSWSDFAWLDEEIVRQPSLQADIHGALVVAAGEGFAVDVIEEGMEFPLVLHDEISRSVLTPNGTSPVLRLAPDGARHVLFGDQYGLSGGEGLQYATFGNGGCCDVETIPGTSIYDGPYDLAIAGDGAAHAIWSSEEGGLYYSRRGGEGWTEPLLLRPDAGSRAVGLAVEANGSVHAVSATFDNGVWYLANRGDAFEPRQLNTAIALSADIALDAKGRAHILFALGDEDHRPIGLWYAASPAR